MSEQTILAILLVIITIEFLFEKWLDYLYVKSANNPIPAELSDVYDQEKYQKSIQYQKVKHKFSSFSSIFSFLLIFLTLYFGWFGLIDGWVRTFSPFDLLTTLFFFGVLFFINEIISIPFEWYHTFVIEQKFGFNKTTVKTFILDKMKGYLLTILIGGLLLALFLYCIHLVGSDFWWYFWIIAIVFMLGVNLFYTSLILPLFNKLTPLPDGDLKNAIFNFSKKVNFPLKNIFVIDGSKRTSKSNAFFSGFGKNKKVVLYDTLIEKHNTEELTAIFAHEVGHYKKNHIYINVLMGIIQIGFILFLLSKMLFNSEISYSMGGELTSIHLNILAFGILFTPVSNLLSILFHVISRKHEYQADTFATKNYKGVPLISALKKLSSDHLSNLNPHPIFVFFKYSHPTLIQRIQNIKKS